jgi:hypothetical protein
MKLNLLNLQLEVDLTGLDLAFMIIHGLMTRRREQFGLSESMLWCSASASAWTRAGG